MEASPYGNAGYQVLIPIYFGVLSKKGITWARNEFCDIINPRAH